MYDPFWSKKSLEVGPMSQSCKISLVEEKHVRSGYQFIKIMKKQNSIFEVEKSLDMAGRGLDLVLHTPSKSNLSTFRRVTDSNCMIGCV